jgi:hypothetical protein
MDRGLGSLDRQCADSHDLALRAEWPQSRGHGYLSRCFEHCLAVLREDPSHPVATARDARLMSDDRNKATSAEHKHRIALARSWGGLCIFCPMQ